MLWYAAFNGQHLERWWQLFLTFNNQTSQHETAQVKQMQHNSVMISSTIIIISSSTTTLSLQYSSMCPNLYYHNWCYCMLVIRDAVTSVTLATAAQVLLMASGRSSIWEGGGVCQVVWWASHTEQNRVPIMGKKKYQLSYFWQPCYFLKHWLATTLSYSQWLQNQSMLNSHRYAK